MKGRLENQIKTEEDIKRLLVNKDEIFSKYLLNLNTNIVKTKYEYLLTILYFFDHSDKLDSKKVSLEQLRRITKGDIQSFLDANKYYKGKDGETKLKSPATEARTISALKNFFEFLVESEVIDKNPVASIKIPKRNELNSVVYMTPDEIDEVKENMLRGIGTTSKKVRQNRKAWSNRNVAILMIGCTMGLRVTAISEINVEDVDFDELTISVTEKGGVTKKVWMGKETAKWIHDWMVDRDELLGDKSSDALFISTRGERITRKGISKMLAQNTITLTKHITPHKMRSSCATNLYNQTENIYLVKDVLGHKNIANTQKYTRQSEAKLRNAASVLEKLYGGK